MTDYPETESRLRTFLRQQASRLEFRALIFGRGLASALFWALALVGTSWLQVYGLGIIPVMFFVAWTVISLPALVFQLILVVDTLLFGFIGKTAAYPILIETLRQQRMLREAKGQLEKLPSLGERLRYRVLYIADVTCPLSAISVWCLIVLSRAPATAHLTRPEVMHEIRNQVRREAELVDVAIGRLAAA